MVLSEKYRTEKYYEIKCIDCGKLVEVDSWYTDKRCYNCARLLNMKTRNKNVNNIFLNATIEKVEVGAYDGDIEYVIVKCANGDKYKFKQNLNKMCCKLL